MEIDLTRPLGADSAADEADVRRVKKALNRLGLYTPFEKIGITGIPDAALFAAIRDFQTRNRLPATGEIRPDDDTLAILNEAVALKPDGYYLWRTVEDDKVRAGHAAYNRTVRAWRDAPDPGEDYNCRCWAEALPQNCAQLSIQIQNTRLQIEHEWQGMLSADIKAKELRAELENLWKNLQEGIKKAGFEISSSFIPDLKGRIPYIEPLLSTAKNAGEIWSLYKNFKKTWVELQEIIETQKWHQNKKNEKEKEITILLHLAKELGCSL